MFKDVVGHFATGVTVVIAKHDEIVYGATVSAVSSLSADPPMALVCLHQKLGTHTAICDSGMFTVNILGEDQGDLARQFAAPGTDKFRGITLATGRFGGPLLADALAHLECRVVNQVVGGTHRVFVAEVLSATARGGNPLSYFRGRFGRFMPAPDQQH